MFEAVESLVTERHELEQQLADPATHTDQALAKRLNQRYAEVSSVVRAWEEWRGLERRPRGGARARGRRARLRRGGGLPGGAAGDGRRAAAPPAGPAGAGRLQGRDPRGEVRRGRRGVGAVRGRPAPHVHPLRRGPRLGHRGARRDRVRPRRLQVRDRRGQGPRRERARRGAVRTAEVRGRRPPGAAGAGHRVPGPGPHQRGRGAGAAGGRAGRRHRRRPRPAHRRLPQQRSRVARASTPPTPRCGSPTSRRASW